MRGNEFAELQAFVAISRHGSFVRAAEELQISPSALSQTIRALEQRIGGRLFNRTTRSLSLTDAGERLLARLAPALDEVAAAVVEVSHLASRPTGRLRVHALRLASRRYLEPIYPAFCEAYPEITLDVVIDDATMDLVAAGFDVGIRLGELLEQDMVGVRLGPELCQVAVASPAYLARHGTPQTPADLHKHRCINWRWPGQVHPYQWEFLGEQRWFSVAVDGPLIVNDQRVALEAAVNGVGIAFWVEDQAEPYVREGKLVRLLEGWSGSFPGFFLCYPQQRQHSPALRAFVDFLRQTHGS